MSEIYIYSKDATRIGILQNQSSVQWLEHYQAPGEVKIVADVTPANLEQLVIGNRLYHPDMGTSAVIVGVECIEGEGLPELTVRAELSSAQLDQRVVMGTEGITNVETGIYQLYSKNRRNLSIEPASAQGYTESYETDVSWESVLEASMVLAEVSGLGFRVDFDPETAKETLCVYKGIDRTVVGSENYIGYLGDDIGNIADIQIIAGEDNYKNVAIVAGEETEGTSREIRTVSLYPIDGAARREVFIDAGDLSRTYQEAKATGEKDENGNPVYEYVDKTYSLTKYRQLLDARGKEELTEYLRDFEVSCRVLQNNLQFGIDYSLGDRLPIKLTRYGMQLTAVVSSVRLIYESNGLETEIELNDFRMEDNNDLFPFG